MNSESTLTRTNSSIAGVANTRNTVNTQRIDAAGGNDSQTLEKAAIEFETLLIAQMLKSMRAATESMSDDDSGSVSRSTTLYTEQLDAEMAKVLASRGGFGFHDMLVRQLGNEQLADDNGSNAPDHASNT